MFVRPTRIISGGQTGVDRAALDAAIALGVPHGGWCPRGRAAEDGRIPDDYQLAEADSPEYHVRTELNVRDSDGTLILFCGTSGAVAWGGTPAERASKSAADVWSIGSSGEPSKQDTAELENPPHVTEARNQCAAADTADRADAPCGGPVIGAEHLDRLEGGTKLTYELARKYRRPALVVDLNHPPPTEVVYQWLAHNRIAVLNVAGPRESNSPGIARRTYDFLLELFGARPDMS